MKKHSLEKKYDDADDGFYPIHCYDRTIYS